MKIKILSLQVEGLPRPESDESALKLWAKLACGTGRVQEVADFLNGKLREAVATLGVEGLMVWGEMARQASKKGGDQVAVALKDGACHLQWKSGKFPQSLDLAVVC